ncbi:hypothetical protein BKA81DRAFT_355572 [Phyllosticta paracitricarpa]
MSFCSGVRCFAFLASTKTINPFGNCAIFSRGPSRRVSGLSLSTTPVTGSWVRARPVQSVCAGTTAPLEIPSQRLTSGPPQVSQPRSTTRAGLSSAVKNLCLWLRLKSRCAKTGFAAAR